MVGIRGVKPCPGWIFLANALNRERKLVSVDSCRRDTAEAGSCAARCSGIETAPVYDQKIITGIKASPLWRSDDYFGGYTFKIGESRYGVCCFIPRENGGAGAAS